MAKPATLDGYSDQYTVACERVLVTLLRGLGPWKDSVYLVGGLTPRYLVPARPPLVPAHAGTMDVDIVIDLQILADTEAYHTLEDNLKRMGFERAENEAGKKRSWRWQTRTEHGALMVLELLANAPDIAGGRVQALPTDGTISALNIPHSSIVFDLHQVTEIQAELLGDNGIATEKIKHANLVSFTCLKAFAFDQRFERKDGPATCVTAARAGDFGKGSDSHCLAGGLVHPARTMSAHSSACRIREWGVMGHLSDQTTRRWAAAPIAPRMPEGCVRLATCHARPVPHRLAVAHQAHSDRRGWPWRIEPLAPPRAYLAVCA
jgi:hypothetical protein